MVTVTITNMAAIEQDRVAWFEAVKSMPRGKRGGLTMNSNSSSYDNDDEANDS